MATANLVWKILVGVALCIIVGTTMMAYIETLYMKAEMKHDKKRIEKKLDEVEQLKQELKESK